MPIPIDQEVNAEGLHLVREDQRWPYRVVQDYSYRWRNRPRGQLPHTSQELQDSTGAPLAVLLRRRVILRTDYRWDGSTYAIDTRKCLKASALHDAWCQAMDEGIFEAGWLNWRRGCLEYRWLCGQAGMSGLRRYGRYSVMVYLYGTWKKMKGDFR